MLRKFINKKIHCHYSIYFSLKRSPTVVDVEVAQKLHKGFAAKQAVFRLTVTFVVLFFHKEKAVF